MVTNGELVKYTGTRQITTENVLMKDGFTLRLGAGRTVPEVSEPTALTASVSTQTRDPQSRRKDLGQRRGEAGSKHTLEQTSKSGLGSEWGPGNRVSAPTPPPPPGPGCGEQEQQHPPPAQLQRASAGHGPTATVPRPRPHGHGPTATVPWPRPHGLCFC